MYLTPLLLFFVTALASVPERPKNEATIVGQSTQLTCGKGSEAPVTWFYTSSKDKSVNILSHGTNIIPDGFSNANATDQGQILNISPVLLENSGAFKCAVNGSEFSAQLIVLESKPVCGTTPNASHQGFVDLWCRVNFTGFWPPHMQWIHGGRKLVTQQQRSSTSLSSTLTVKAESIGSIASYICKTYFVEDDNPFKDAIQIAKNVPDFTITFTSDAGYNSTTQNTALNYESTTRQSPVNTNGIMWILTSCAALACLVVFVVIVYYIRKHPDVCKKSSEPDLVQNAEIIQFENRVDVHPPELGPGFNPEEPEERHENNIDYAEVVVLDRKLPSYMQDSPAWNNQHHGACSKSVQNSPAWSHSSKNVPYSRGATPRNGSPMVNITDVEYLDINSVATIPVPQGHAPRRPPARLPTFQAVSYASIDHTSRPPPPLPPDDN